MQNTLTSLREESFFAIWTKFPIKKIRAPTLGSDVVSPPPSPSPLLVKKKLGLKLEGIKMLHGKRLSYSNHDNNLILHLIVLKSQERENLWHQIQCYCLESMNHDSSALLVPVGFSPCFSLSFLNSDITWELQSKYPKIMTELSHPFLERRRKWLGSDL